MPDDAARQRAQQALEVAAKATPGPWTWEARSMEFEGSGYTPYTWPEEGFLQFDLTGPTPVCGRGDFVGRDAVFVAEARRLVPALAADVLRLLDGIEQTRQRLEAGDWGSAYLYVKALLAGASRPANVEETVAALRQLCPEGALRDVGDPVVYVRALREGKSVEEAARLSREPTP